MMKVAAIRITSHTAPLHHTMGTTVLPDCTDDFYANLLLTAICCLASRSGFPFS